MYYRTRERNIIYGWVQLLIRLQASWLEERKTMSLCIWELFELYSAKQWYYYCFDTEIASLGGNAECLKGLPAEASVEFQFHSWLLSSSCIEDLASKTGLVCMNSGHGRWKSKSLFSGCAPGKHDICSDFLMRPPWNTCFCVARCRIHLCQLPCFSALLQFLKNHKCVS